MRARLSGGPRGGFTLLELIAAVALSGLVTAGVWRLASQLAEVEERIRVAQSSFMTLVNAERLVRSVVAHAELDSLAGARFTGNSTAASFQSCCLASGGWLERCRVALGVFRARDSSAVVLRIGAHDADDVVVVRRRGAATLLYYDSAQPADPWSTTWTSDVALPDAVGIAFRDPADTLVLPTGTR